MFMISRRSLLAAPLLGALPLGAARAQDYPSKVVRIVVPTSPGSGTDTVARHVAATLGKAWNASVIVENKPGAGVNIATDYVAKAAPDGYTLLFTYAAHYSNTWVDKAPYDPIRDFEPVARMANSALVLLTHAHSPLRTVRDVIAAAKEKPGAVTYATAGNGTTGHMAGALLSTMAGISLNHIPYKTPSQTALDTAGGLVDVGFNGISTAIPLIRSGRLRPLAVTTAKRSAFLPEVPTIAEAGFAGYEISSPIWMMAPRGTPAAIVERLSDALTRIASTPEFREACAIQGIEPDVQNAATARAAAPAELEKWRKLVALTAAKSN
jgi:tripartite-type tricarboxylate transporter receptor subunit TctC